jgi:hypothetical protein
MTQIIASVPTTALNATSQLSRHRLRVMQDGYRVVLFTDGANLLLRSSQTGSTTWSASTTVIAGVTTMDATLCSVMVGNNLYIFRISGTSILCTRLPYSGAGVFGTAVNTTPITGLASTPGSVRAVYDVNGTTLDSQHTSGTGIIHVLSDAGGTWYLNALDPNTSATAPKSVLSTSISVGFSSPTYTTEMVLRVSGSIAKLFVLGYGASGGGWKSYDISYQSGTVTTTSTTTGATTYGPGSNSYMISTTAVGFGVNNPVIPAGHTYQMGASTSNTGNFGLDLAFGTNADRGVSFAMGGYTFPTGTWTWSESFSWSGISVTAGTNFQISLRIYSVVGGVYTLRGTLTGSAHDVTVNSFFSCTGSVTGFAIPAAGSLFVTPNITVSGFDANGSPGSPAYLLESGRTLSTTAPTVTSTTTTTVNAYTVPTAQTPSLPSVSSGAGLCLSDTSSNPGVDIFVNDGSGNIKSTNRDANGVYSPIATIATGALAGYGPGASANTTSGDEVVFFPVTNHIDKVVRTNGAWGTPTLAETSATTVQTGAAVAPPEKYGTIGPAVAYVNGSGTFNMQYEDGGFAAGAVAPTVSLALVNATGQSVVFGTGSPFVSTSLTPTTRLTYNETLANDRMGALQVPYTDITTPSAPTVIVTGLTSGTTVYDYKVTFVTPAGESLPSAAGHITNGQATASLSGTNYNALTNIPKGPADCTARKIWRSVSSAAYALKTTIADNTTTVFNDQSSATSAGTIPSVGPTVWDSGRTSVGDGPLPGGTYDYIYNGFGATAVTSLSPGHDYSETATAYDAVGGNQSAAATAITVSVRSAPTATSFLPATITSVSPNVSFIANQAEGVQIGGYRLAMVADDGLTDYDTGFVSITPVNSGSTIAFTPSLAGFIRNNRTYTATVTLTTAPTSGPAWTGTTALSVPVAVPTVPAPIMASAVWNAGTTPLTGGSIDVTFNPGNALVSGDDETSDGSITYFQDPFNSLGGWDTTVASPTVASNLVTFPIGAALEATNAPFYRNFTWRTRFKTPSTTTSWTYTLSCRKDASNSYFIQQTGGNISVSKTVATVTTSLGSTTAAIAASTFYWMDFTLSFAGNTATLTATQYADSSGVIGAQIGTVSATDTAIGAYNGYLRVDMGVVAGGQLGGKTDGSGCKVTGVGPSGWIPSSTGWTSNTAIPDWLGWTFETALTGSSQRALTAHATSTAGTHDGAWTQGPLALPSPSDSWTFSLQGKLIAGTAASKATAAFYTGSGTGLVSSLTLAPTLTGSWSRFQGTNTGFITANYVTVTLGLTAAGQTHQWDQMQVETGSTANIFVASASTLTAHIYQRASATTLAGAGAWVRAISPTPTWPLQTNSLLSVTNSDSFDIAVAMVDSSGFESAWVITSNVRCVFKYGLWLNQASAPATRLELGIVKMGDSDIEWTVNDDSDFAELFDRAAPVLTVGTLFHDSSADVRFTLPIGYEDLCEAQLRSWKKNGTTLQVRDPAGRMIWGALRTLTFGFGDFRNIRAVTLSLQQIDTSGVYGLLAV